MNAESARTPGMRLALVLLALMAAIAVLANGLKPTQRLADVKPKIDLASQVPAAFSSWKEDSFQVPILPSPDVQARLDALYSATLARTYINPQGLRVMLSIAYGSDQSSEATAVHRPEFCYSSQGFSVENAGTDQVEIGGRKILVQRLISRQGNRYEPITYWVILDERATLPGIGRKLTQLKYGLQGKIPDGMLVRTSAIGLGKEESFKLQDRFLAELFLSMDPAIRARYFGA